MGIYLAIALGSALGGVGRYWLSGVIDHRIGETYPYGTLVVNITGCLAIGLFASLTGPDGRLLVGPGARQFFMIGVCGGYTTFSSFGLQTLNLARDGQLPQAASYIASSVLGCLAAVWAGHAAGSSLNALRGS